MMKLMTMKQYMKMSKAALIRKITKSLRVMPKAKLARLCYNITKSKLPRLRTRHLTLTQQLRAINKPRKPGTGRIMTQTLSKRYQRMYPGKTKRKFSRKQLAAQRLFAKRARAGTLKRRRR